MDTEVAGRDANMTSSSGCVDNDSSDDLALEMYRILVPTLFSAIITAGTLGNGLVIYVIASQPKLRNVTNLLLLNLAVSDVAFLLICGTFSVGHYVLPAWPLGQYACRLAQYLLYVTCYVTVYTLVAVAIVRYISVVHGTQCRVLNQKWVVVVIVLLWIIVLLAKIPILLVHGVSYNESTDRLECIISGKTHGQQLFGAFFVFAYVLPLSLIASLSCLIVRHLRSAAPAPGAASLQQRDGTRQSHVTRVLGLLVATFAACWLPLHVHLLAAYYASIPDSLTYKLLLIVWHSLVYVNSMLNPIIYNCFSSEFRESFRTTILCGKPSAADEYELC